MNFGDPEKTKKILMFSIIGVVALAIILVIVLSIASSISASKNNVVINEAVSKMPEGLVQLDTAGNVYISVEQFAPLVSYEFYNGEYGKATEDRTKCYVKNSNEVATFEMNSYNMYKMLLANSDNMYDKYVQALPIKRVNDKLYASLATIQRAFNVQIAYDKDKGVLAANTLSYIASAYDTQVKNAGYTSLAEEFVNQKAILNGLLVVVKDREYYGVISTTGETVIGTKYKKIEYMENTEEFLILTNNKYGILTKTATTKVEPTYDQIKVINSENGLYLAKSNDKYGILKKDGSALLYMEYEQIGVKDVDTFPNDNIKNPYILFDNVIPAYKDGKWGFYGIDGALILAFNRVTALGCVSTTNKSEAYKNVLLIPESEGTQGIVVGTTNSYNNTTYGIFNPQSKRLLTPMTFTKVYRDVVNGEEAYYMIFSGTVSTVKSRITANITGANDGTTVNVKDQNTQNANNNMDTNSIDVNTIDENTVETNKVDTSTSNVIDSGSNQKITIDSNSTDPVVIQ